MLKAMRLRGVCVYSLRIRERANSVKVLVCLDLTKIQIWTKKKLKITKKRQQQGEEVAIIIEVVGEKNVKVL